MRFRRKNLRHPTVLVEVLYLAVRPASLQFPITTVNSLPYFPFMRRKSLPSDLWVLMNVFQRHQFKWSTIAWAYSQ
ncbi:hypothetical protein SeMB42_g01443 [Synchytrium endobioticum]|uniref:Uncharacterized protein n=1 Tax=Synchytrium endobioticum TaxID=286115 RepID=A0A507DLU2_9FUNG|nr:hypothetical protein SeMB42_g01443 [Synchytrium endobioticum]